MTTRERHAESVATAGEIPFDAEAGSDLERLRETGDAFLEAADEAMEQALSRDARAFLSQNRQVGGQ
jgi:hypothetical protein